MKGAIQVPGYAKNFGALRRTSHLGSSLFSFYFFLSLHSSTLIHSRQEMSPLMVSRSGHGRQQARSKNIISARPRIITLQRPKNDRHPTSFNHGIMKVDFFSRLSPLLLCGAAAVAATMIICWQKCLWAKLASSRLTVNLILRNPRCLWLVRGAARAPHRLVIWRVQGECDNYSGRQHSSTSCHLPFCHCVLHYSLSPSHFCFMWKQRPPKKISTFSCCTWC